jgi:L-fucose isomerase-like protein
MQPKNKLQYTLSRPRDQSPSRPSKIKTMMTIAVLPVGEFEDEPVKKEFAAVLSAIRRLGTMVIVADPVSDEESARRSVQALSENGPDLLVIVPLRGRSAQVIEAAALASPVACLLYPVQGRFALPSSALAVGALREADIPVELLYAPPDLPDTLERLRRTASAASAFSRIRKSRIGLVGGLFPNLVSCRYDPQIVSARLGVTLLPVSFETVRSSIQAIAPQGEAMEKAHQELTNSYNLRAADGNSLEAGIKLHLALKQLALDQKIDGFAAECWSAFPQEIGLNPCLGFIEDAYTLACEGDVMLCISLLIVRYLTGSRAYTGDLYDLDMDGNLTLVHCGAPASLAADKGKVKLAQSEVALERGFESLTCRPQLVPGPVTLFRLYGRECDHLHMAAGELLDSKQSPGLMATIKIKGDRGDFLEQCLGNHYVAAAGDIRKEMELLCKWLKITLIET